jgi:lipopolysaccharide/colanic/teichoic acid biosynthesis glycosyltransferase
MPTTTRLKPAAPVAWSAVHGVRIPAWKRGFDLILICFALPFLVPAFLVIGLMIRLLSRGPIFFRRERIGHRGEPFLCLKFRTMKVNACTSGHEGHLATLISSDAPMTKLDKMGDPRLIVFGRILRSSGLDELPQLLNVLKGEMTLVGPRPCMRYEYDRYEEWHKQRFNAFPGLTGLWQVSGKNKTTFNQMIQLDIDYAAKMSLWLDLKIVLKTVPVLLGQICEMYTRAAKRKATRSVSPPSVP